MVLIEVSENIRFSVAKEVNVSFSYTNIAIVHFFLLFLCLQLCHECIRYDTSLINASVTLTIGNSLLQQVE